MYTEVTDGQNEQVIHSSELLIYSESSRGGRISSATALPFFQSRKLCSFLMSTRSPLCYFFTSVPSWLVLGAVVGLVRSCSGFEFAGLGAVVGLAVSLEQEVLLAVAGSVVSCLGFEVVAGCQRKNSCNSVLTVSGHSIITMWLPSSMTFRKPRSRICGE